MESFVVQRSSFQGEMEVPASKSHTLRAILFGTLGQGKTVVYNPLHSTDSMAMIEACRLLGAKIDLFEDRLEIQGLGGRVEAVEDVIQANNSGIVLRFISAIAALSPHYTTITGDASIRHQRPIQPLLDGLTQLGAWAVSARGDQFAPVIIRGPMQPGTAFIDGMDSQPVSALLIVCAFLKGATHLHVKNPGEKPWVDLTLDWLTRLGIPYVNDNYTHYELPGGASYPGFNYTVPADLSSAAFPVVAALITGSELHLSHVDMHDVQGDKAFIHLLQKMGALIAIDHAKKSLSVQRGGKLKGVNVDINAFIDAVPILAVVACFAEGETRITNAAVARQKESDRLYAITTELKKMGADIQELPDGLIIQGGKPLQGATLFSHRDQRIAMSLAIAALGASGKSLIEDVACAAKTYPSFAADFKAQGAQLEVVYKHG